MEKDRKEKKMNRVTTWRRQGWRRERRIEGAWARVRLRSRRTVLKEKKKGTREKNEREKEIRVAQFSKNPAQLNLQNLKRPHIFTKAQN